MQTKITIVICTYNGEKYLAEVIESVVNQDGFDDYVEKLKVVDNASTDNTKNIILKYQKIYSKVEYVFEEKPGVSHARKHGALVDSDWIAYVDDDNILFPKWLIGAIHYITKNPEIGVFNGASIATIRDSITKDERIMLNSIYQDLACTHVGIEEYKNGLSPAIKRPFGAGMVLRAHPLKEFLDNGWTNNVGRKGKELGSGEDGEIASYVLSKGYKYGYNNEIALSHVIPEVRLQPNYVERLMRGLVEGYYSFISDKRNYVFYRIKTFMKSIYIILINPIKMIFDSNEIRRAKYKLEIDTRLKITKLILNDFFILKK